jgi:hypothetical protein
MLTHDGRRFEADRSVAKGRTLSAASHDADVLSHDLFTNLSLRVYPSCISGGTAQKQHVELRRLAGAALILCFV